MIPPTKNLAKWLRKELRERGGVVTQEEEHFTVVSFDDGSNVTIPKRLTPGRAATILRRADQISRTSLRRFPTGSARRVRGPKPTIDIATIRFTTHAKQRIAEMQATEDFSIAELAAVLTSPDHVLYSDLHNTWMWTGHRLAVCVRAEPDHSVVTTVMWADADLWSQHPRPEKTQ